MGQFRKALFLHTQKTAGTSIVAAAQAHYGVENVMSHADYVTIETERFDRAPFISGHFGFAFAKPRMEGRYAFTFLRDPVERIISLYSFCRSMNSSEYPIYAAAKKGTLEEFLLGWRELSGLDRVGYIETINNNQAWQLCYGWEPYTFVRKAMYFDFEHDKIKAQALENLGRFDYVGFVETFCDDFEHIWRDLGFANQLSFTRHNVSENRLRIQDVPAGAMDLLLSFTELDREIYQIAWLRRQQRQSLNNNSLIENSVQS